MRTEYFSIMNQKRNNKKHKTGSDNFKLNEVKVIDWLTVQVNTTVHSAPARLQWRGGGSSNFKSLDYRLTLETGHWYQK
jgi:hypothetical protein